MSSIRPPRHPQQFFNSTSGLQFVLTTEPDGMSTLASGLEEFATLLERVSEESELSATQLASTRAEVRSYRTHLLTLVDYFPSATAGLTLAEIRFVVSEAAEAAERLLAVGRPTPADLLDVETHVRRVRDQHNSLGTALRSHRTVVESEVLVCDLGDQAQRLIDRLDREPPRGTKEPVASLFRAAVDEIAHVTQFLQRLPDLWKRPDEYRQLAARVRSSAAALSAAYRAGEPYLLQAAGDRRGAFLEVLDFLTAFAEQCPDGEFSEPDLNRALTRLFLYRDRMPGKQLIRRLRTEASTANGFLADNIKPVAKKSGGKARKRPTTIGFKGEVYLAIQNLKREGMTESDILSHLNKQEGKHLSTQIEKLINDSQTKSRGPKKGLKRTRKDVIRAALRRTYSERTPQGS